MSTFAMYDAGGVIRCLVNGDDPPPMGGLQAVEAPADLQASDWYVADGALVAYTPEQLAARSGKPTRRAVWSNTLMAWVDPRTLADAKAEKWERIKAERERRLAGTFTAGGKVFDIDLTNITAAALDARLAIVNSESWQQAWVLHDNTTVTLTATQMLGVMRACRAAVAAIMATAQALRDQINAATTVAEVEAVSWPA